MATFTDSSGRDWAVAFDGFVFAEVKSRYGLDLDDLVNSWQSVFSSAGLWQVLCVACQEQMQRREVSQRDFAKILTGDVLSKARAAVEQALQDFFPQSDWSAISGRLEHARKLSEDMATAQPILERLEKLPPQVQAAILRQVMEAAKSGGEVSASHRLVKSLTELSSQDSDQAKPVSRSRANAESVLVD